MKRPNQYSHAFVLSNYTNHGLIDNNSPSREQQPPPFPTPVRSSYQPIARPARFTYNDLSNQLKRVPPKSNGEPENVSDVGAGVSMTTEKTVLVRRSNSVITQVYAPDSITAPPATEVIATPLVQDGLLELEENDDFTTNSHQRSNVPKGRRNHRHDESVITQIFAPIVEPSESPIPETPPLRIASRSGTILKSKKASVPHRIEAGKRVSSRYRHEVPRSWVSFGERNSRYWKPLPQEPWSAITYDISHANSATKPRIDLGISTSAAHQSSKRCSNDSGCTGASTDSPRSPQQQGTPATTPGTISPTLTTSPSFKKPSATASPPRASRIPVLAPRRSCSTAEEIQTPHRRISSQLSEDFRTIDRLTMELLLHSPPRDDSADDREDHAEADSPSTKGEGIHGEGEEWLYPPTGPEIFCTPPKLPSSLASNPKPDRHSTTKRSSFSRYFSRPHVSRLPSQVSFSGFSDPFPANDDDADGGRQSADEEERYNAAIPPPIARGRDVTRFPERSNTVSSHEKRGPSFRDFMRGRGDRLSEKGGKQRPASPTRRSGRTRSRTSSLTGFISTISRRASTASELAAATQGEGKKAGVEGGSIPSEKTELPRTESGPAPPAHQRETPQPRSDLYPYSPAQVACAQSHHSVPPPANDPPDPSRHKYWPPGSQSETKELDQFPPSLHPVPPPVPPPFKIDAEVTRPIIPADTTAVVAVDGDIKNPTNEAPGPGNSKKAAKVERRAPRYTYTPRQSQPRAYRHEEPSPLPPMLLSSDVRKPTMNEFLVHERTLGRHGSGVDTAPVTSQHVPDPKTMSVKSWRIARFRTRLERRIGMSLV